MAGFLFSLDNEESLIECINRVYILQGYRSLGMYGEFITRVHLQITAQ